MAIKTKFNKSIFCHCFYRSNTGQEFLFQAKDDVSIQISSITFIQERSRDNFSNNY